MNPAREETLAAIRSALTRPAPGRPQQPCDPPPVPPLLGDEQLLELFLDRAAGCGATVTACTPDSVAEALRPACARHRASRLVIPSGLPAQWRPDGVELVTDQGLTVAALDEFDGVITRAAVAIAESAPSCSTDHPTKAAERSP